MGILGRFKVFNRAVADSASIEKQTPADEANRLLEEGMSLEAAGQVKEALNRYNSAIDLQPSLGRAHFNRGNLLLEEGASQEALAAFSNALRCKPDSAACYYNMGNAQVQLKQFSEAIESYQRALKLKPGFEDAEVAMGVALQETGSLEEAIACFRRALVLRPTYAEVHYNLGGAMVESKKLTEAIFHFRQAIAIKPDYIDAYAKLGVAQQELRQFEELIQTIHRLLDLKPDNVEALNNIGAALSKLGEHQKAAEFYRQALELSPDQAELHSNLGVVYKTLGQHEEALTCYRRALEIKPDFPEAHSNQGMVLHQLGRFSEALASYKKALALDPNCIDAANNLGVLQQQMGQLDSAIDTFSRLLIIAPRNVETISNLASVFADKGQLQEAASTYRSALAINPDYTIARSNLLFIHNYLASNTTNELFAEAEEFGKIVTRNKPAALSFPLERNPNRRLRIGFVSADLRQHPVGYFAEGVIAALHKLARDEIELFGYSNYWQMDAIGERIKSCCEGWRMVRSMTDERLAQTIQNDKIDILIDLSGHTCDNRLPLFGFKPAPIQVSWLGYFATTGVREIDYLIADPWTLPESEERNFTETIWRLPETRLCFTPPTVGIEVGTLPALKNGYITFGCFNNLTKINDQVIAEWARILTTLPTSRLMLKAYQLQEVSVREELIKRFATHQISPNRLILEAYSPRTNYLAAYHQVDIALDPFPYPGGTTTVEALWMGVPVLTLSGKSFLARQGVGLLMNAGLPNWVADTLDDYVARAVSHANDLTSLAVLREGLREQVLGSPIFDNSRFARHFAAALRGMWGKWCDEHPVVSSVT